MKRIIAGPNAVTEAVNSDRKNIKLIYLAKGLNPKTAKRITEAAEKYRITTETVPKETIEQLSCGLNHQGVAAITGGYPFAGADEVFTRALSVPNPLLLILDQIQDTGNLGALMRSSYGLGAAGMVITKDRSATVTDAAVRASSGASELIKIARVTNLAEYLTKLKKNNFIIMGADARSEQTLYQMDFKGPVALVLGNEGNGLRQLTKKRCDFLFKIPMANNFESLNVAAAGAICLYEAARQKNA
jgi:23S rRNA (guanosine2251-2'-O)-methyltransferase